MKMPVSRSTTFLLSAAALVTSAAFSTPALAQGAPGVMPGVPGYSPPKLEWSKGDPIPPGYHPSTEVRTGFVIGGATALGVSWVFGGVTPGILMAVGGAGGYAVPLFIPAIGPFISMATLGAAANTSVGGAALAILALDGVVQSTGAALLIYGLVAQRDVLIRNDKVGNTTVRWKPTPMALGLGGQGFGIVGTF